MFSTATVRKPSAMASGVFFWPVACSISSRVQQACAHDLDIERLLSARSEHGWKELRAQLAEHDIAIGHGERAAATIRGGTRVGPGTFRADPELGAIEATDRAAASRHGVDLHDRRA
jgi:hypothetical protein